LAITNWRLRRWRLWFLALMTATLPIEENALERKQANENLQFPWKGTGRLQFSTFNSILLVS